MTKSGVTTQYRYTDAGQRYYKKTGTEADHVERKGLVTCIRPSMSCPAWRSSE